MGVNHDEKDGEALKRDEQSQRVEAPSQSTGSKESMVQNPSTPLQVSESRNGYEHASAAGFRTFGPKL